MGYGTRWHYVHYDTGETTHRRLIQRARSRRREGMVGAMCRLCTGKVLCVTKRTPSRNDNQAQTTFRRCIGTPREGLRYEVGHFQALLGQNGCFHAASAGVSWHSLVLRQVYEWLTMVSELASRYPNCLHLASDYPISRRESEYNSARAELPNLTLSD
jgi:hypothetical protein